jgi:hypothetical protein
VNKKILCLLYSVTTKTLEILFTLQHQMIANHTIDNEDLITTNDVTSINVVKIEDL